MKAFARFFLFVATVSAVVESSAGTPNIVFIMADDHGRRATSCYVYYGAVGVPRAANWIAYHEIIGVRTATAKLIYYPTWKR